SSENRTWARRVNVEICSERDCTPAGGMKVSWSQSSTAPARLRSVTSARMSFSSWSFALVFAITPPTGILPNEVAAPLAQWIEHLPSKQGVGGSNPSRGAFLDSRLAGCAAQSAPLTPNGRILRVDTHR